MKYIKVSHHLILVFFLLFLNMFALSQPWIEHGKIEVSKKNPHYFQFEDGTPFFWLADTGWEMIHRLNRSEINIYLDNRRLKGYNVIQTVIISEFMYSDKATNYYNDSIFADKNPLHPKITEGSNPENSEEYDYWDHVDYAVHLAEDKGLYLALLPTWGEWVIPRNGHALFTKPEMAYDYGNFLGQRYKKSNNIVWILGGDRHPDERKDGADYWRAMAEGIADGTNGIDQFDGQADFSTTLISHHSYNSSSNWFQNDEWIDFDMWGSYHAEINNPRSYQLALFDYNLPHPKPTINAEPCYEGHGINYAIDDNGVFTSTDVRMAAYWSVFSGAAGFTYGAQPVWQFSDSIRLKLSPKTFADWKHGMDYPGASQLIHLKNLMGSIPLFELHPDQRLIAGGQGACANYCAAISTKSMAMVYIPQGYSPVIQMGLITGAEVMVSWYNPRTGENTEIGIFENSGNQLFSVPGMSKTLNWLKTGRGCDWVLILKDTSVL